MKSRLVRIGNSRGVRLPKALIDEAGLEDEVEIRAEGRSIVITPSSRIREGWAEDAARAAATGDHRLLDPPSPTRFDQEEWKW
jgi:antitoxin MazE